MELTGTNNSIGLFLKVRVQMIQRIEYVLCMKCYGEWRVEKENIEYTDDEISVLMKRDGIDWLGSYGGCDTHDPIPNSIVKPSSANDTSA